MKNWTYEELMDRGYTIENVKIVSVNLSMVDYGSIQLQMEIKGNSFGCTYGGYALGSGYLGAKEFSSFDYAMEYIMRIMDVVGVSRFQDLKGQYIRIAREFGGILSIIGNLIEDKWFDQKSFVDDKNKDKTHLTSSKLFTKDEQWRLIEAIDLYKLTYEYINTDKDLDVDTNIIRNKILNAKTNEALNKLLEELEDDLK